MVDNLEKILHQEAPPEEAPATPRGGSIFDTIGNSIDNLVEGVKAIPKVIKEATYYTYYTAKAAAGLAAGLALAGTTHALIFPAGMAAGTLLANWKNKEKPSFKQIANELAIGGILGGILHYFFLGINHVGNIVKNAYGSAASLAARGGLALAQLPVFLRTHEYLNRALISDYKPKTWKDMGKAITKGPLKWLVPLVLANFTVVPDYLGPQYQMPWAAGVSTTYGLLKAEPKKKEEKPTPQPAGMPGYGMPRPD